MFLKGSKGCQFTIPQGLIGTPLTVQVCNLFCFQWIFRPGIRSLPIDPYLPSHPKGPLGFDWDKFSKKNNELNKPWNSALRLHRMSWGVKLPPVSRNDWWFAAFPSLTSFLVGGWTNPFEKYARQNGFIFPQVSGWKFKKYMSCHHLVLVD